MSKFLKISLVAGLVCAIIGGLLIYNLQRADAVENEMPVAEQPAQGGATSTPAPIILPTGSATAIPPTETPTRTPTNVGPAQVEAKNTGTNVRATADITAAIVGVIQPGTRYVVRGRYFEWYQIVFPDAANGVGWTHQSVVNLIGDEGTIPDLTVEELPTQDPLELAVEETLVALTQTPGGLLTATAQAQNQPEAAFTQAPQVEAPTLAPGQHLPTFTFPPFTPTPVAVADLRGGSIEVVDDEAVPPLIPIAGLVAVGLAGLFISILRRS